ncbi:MAG: methyltransferase type 11 [Rhizobiales bacterium]|nr:methyltransferase type 11 [Hyphomicrobiales bacterium]
MLTLPLALRNTFRLLKPGGVFRLVVPDLRWRAARYLTAAANGKSEAADDFMNSCGLGKKKRPARLIDYTRECFGKSAHLWMYDFDGLKNLLEDAGFASVRRVEFGDSVDPLFAKVEDRDRFFEGNARELAIAAKRPNPNHVLQIA